MIDGVAHDRQRAGRSRNADELAAKRSPVMNVWRSGEPIRDTPAERYFTRRGLPWLVECPWLRYHPNCPYPVTDKYGCWLGLYAPAVIALLLDPHDHVAGVQKTFITADGNLAPLEPCRVTVGQVPGNAIHLHTAGYQLVVAEVLETAAQAAMLLGRPAWAACRPGNLADSMRLPALPLASEVIIACNYIRPSIRPAEAAAARWRKEGRNVQLASPDLLRTDLDDIPLGQVRSKPTPLNQHPIGQRDSKPFGGVPADSTAKVPPNPRPMLP